jgi:acyl-CoA hydrolase
MFSDGVLPLIENGNITNAKKPFYQGEASQATASPPNLVMHLDPIQPVSLGKVVTSFCSGTRRLYDFIDDNPAVLFLDVAHVNNTHIISKQHDMVAVNSCIEVGLYRAVVRAA